MDEKRLDDIEAAVRRLRADLMATNQAFYAVVTTLTQDQRDAALARLAQLSVMQEQYVESKGPTNRPDTMKLAGEAIERMYKALQDVDRLAKS